MLARSQDLHLSHSTILKCAPSSSCPSKPDVAKTAKMSLAVPSTWSQCEARFQVVAFSRRLCSLPSSLARPRMPRMPRMAEPAMVWTCHPCCMISRIFVSQTPGVQDVPHCIASRVGKPLSAPEPFGSSTIVTQTRRREVRLETFWSGQSPWCDRRVFSTEALSSLDPSWSEFSYASATTREGLCQATCHDGSSSISEWDPMH